jgi:KUP system potassium uptake protein
VSNHKDLQKLTAAGLLISLGIIYGDIGTSPLYVFKAIVGSQSVSPLLILGGVSCIFWTLTMQTTLKYVVITLRADNKGEGGIFSLFSLVRRKAKWLIVPAVVGGCALLADGIITPPITISSAIEGLETEIPHLHTVSIVIAIIAGLFIIQQFGTSLVGKAFGPIMFIWFTMMGVLGVLFIAQDPSIVRALNPYYAIKLLTTNPNALIILGAVFLCTTGAEALYSDLGHCGIKNIRITWIFVKISLTASYLGQAAWLMHSNITDLKGSNPFFEMMPHWFLLSSIIIATAATIIASQALISGSFTLISEAMNMNFWPRVVVRQPTNIKGQIYIPSVNTILWVGCLLMILYFRNSEHMQAAYGFSITVAMMMTSYLLGFYMYYNLKWNKFAVLLILTVFGIVELSFFIANSAKIKERWMFLFFELFIFLTMYVWYYARKINNRFVKFVDLSKHAPMLTEISQDDSIPKFSTHLIYLTKANSRNQVEDKIIKSIFSKKPKRADVYWFLHIHRTEAPYTMSYDVKELVDDKVIKINIHLGFRIQSKAEMYFKQIVKELVANKELNLHIRPDGSTKYNPEPDFKFVVIEKFLSVENEFTLRDGLLLNSYFFLKSISLSDEKAFGLDKSDVVVEQIPLVYQQSHEHELERVK